MTSKFAINIIEVSAKENMSSLNQLSNSKKYLLPKAANSHNCCRNRILQIEIRLIKRNTKGNSVPK